MKNQKFYYNKIKFFILITTLISQIFICATFSYSYLDSKLSNHKTLSESQKSYYNQAISTLSSKIDNMLYMFDDSGAIDFCSNNNIYNSYDETSKVYSDLKKNLDYSDMSDRYFSGFYLLGSNSSNFSLYKLDETFSHPYDFRLDYQSLMNFDRPNDFNKNYQNIYRFDKSSLKDLRIDNESKTSYDAFLNALDGKYVYFTIRKSVLCLLVFNDNIFDEIFKSAEINDTSVILKNNSGNIIYSTITDNTDLIRNDEYIETDKRFSLAVRSPIRYTWTDLIFFAMMLFVCGIIIFIMIHFSDYFAAKIMEPYRILSNFFRLNIDAEEFELSSPKSSTRKRIVITKIFFRAYLYTIFIPSLISLVFSTVVLNFSTGYFTAENLSITHNNTINELYDSFDFFIAKNIANTENSRFNYTVTIDPEYNLVTYPSESQEYSNVHKFRKTLKALSPKAKTGTIINITNDLYGERALGILKRVSDEQIYVKVIKSTSIDNISLQENINFLITDANGNIVIQSPYIDQKDHKYIESKSSKFIRKYKFEEFGWTLFTFVDAQKESAYNNRIIIINLLIVMLFLMIFALISWYFSVSFTHPIEYIISSISNYDTNKHQTDNNLLYNNEIEELLAIYNQMLQRIKKISDEKLSVLIEKEHLNALKIQAELNSLQHQINPHFLYNTLQTISLNISSYNSNEIMKITSCLSEIYRYATSAGDSFFLCDEFENLRNYIYIWSALFPGRYHVEYDIDPDTEIVPSLKLILQPIVENSFMHAFDNMPEGCRITIKAYIEDDNVVISISDNGHGMSDDELNRLQNKMKDTTKPLTGKGIGICNLYRRLMLAYGDDFEFKIQSTKKQGTTVTMRFNICCIG